jgi:hypothetical protein
LFVSFLLFKVAQVRLPVLDILRHLNLLGCLFHLLHFGAEHLRLTLLLEEFGLPLLNLLILFKLLELLLFLVHISALSLEEVFLLAFALKQSVVIAVDLVQNFQLAHLLLQKLLNNLNKNWLLSLGLHLEFPRGLCLKHHLPLF